MALLAIAAFVFGLWAVSPSSSSAAISSVAGKPSEPIVESVIPFLNMLFSPTCRVRAYQSSFRLLSPLILSKLQISVRAVGSQLPGLNCELRRLQLQIAVSGHSAWTSTAWALPALNRELQI